MRYCSVRALRLPTSRIPSAYTTRAAQRTFHTHHTTLRAPLPTQFLPRAVAETRVPLLPRLELFNLPLCQLPPHRDGTSTPLPGCFFCHGAPTFWFWDFPTPPARVTAQHAWHHTFPPTWALHRATPPALPALGHYSYPPVTTSTVMVLPTWDGWFLPISRNVWLTLGLTIGMTKRTITRGTCPFPLLCHFASSRCCILRTFGLGDNDMLPAARRHSYGMPSTPHAGQTLRCTLPYSYLYCACLNPPPAHATFAPALPFVAVLACWTIWHYALR